MISGEHFSRNSDGSIILIHLQSGWRKRVNRQELFKEMVRNNVVKEKN